MKPWMTLLPLAVVSGYGASMFAEWENLRKATEAKKLVKQELERRFA